MDYAYVLLVMKDEQYALGAIACAYSLKLTKTKYDIVCMVTEDISKDIINILEKVMNRVIIVPYLTAATSSLKTNKQTSYYSNWQDISFTKWNCLNLTEYKKVLFVDADKIILQNLDHLFELDTPAGTFSSTHSEYYLNRGIRDPYYSLTHGMKVSDSMIDFGLYGNNYHNSFVVIGTNILLSPDKDVYKHVNTLLQQYNKNNPFGFKCYSMTDEQFITYLYYKYLPFKTGNKYIWTYISQKHNWICWKYNWLRKNETPPTVVHFFGIKPWILKRHEWLDLEVWWKFVKKMISDIYSNDDNIIKLYRKEELELNPLKGCFYCKVAQKKWDDHDFLNDDCIIQCKFYLS